MTPRRAFYEVRVDGKPTQNFLTRAAAAAYAKARRRPGREVRIERRPFAVADKAQPHPACEVDEETLDRMEGPPCLVAIIERAGSNLAPLRTFAPVGETFARAFADSFNRGNRARREAKAVLIPLAEAKLMPAPDGCEGVNLYVVMVQDRRGREPLGVKLKREDAARMASEYNELAAGAGLATVHEFCAPPAADPRGAGQIPTASAP